MTAITSSVLDPNRPTLPEWTRWAWGSMVERDYWKPLFDRLMSLREEIEWITVIEGIRPAMYIFIKPEDLLQVNMRAAKHGLVVVPTIQVNIQNNTYSSGSSNGTFDASKPWHYRALIATKDVLPLILETENIATNNEVLGQVLGYQIGRAHV